MLESERLARALHWEPFNNSGNLANGVRRWTIGNKYQWAPTWSHALGIPDIYHRDSQGNATKYLSTYKYR